MEFLSVIVENPCGGPYIDVLDVEALYEIYDILILINKVQ